VALVGESGSGKTTLLRCFNRLVDPDSGVISVDGADVRQSRGSRLRRHRVRAAGGWSDAAWTVRRNVELVPWLIGVPNATAMVGDAMRLSRVPRRALTALPANFGGQRQRVAMARALAARQRVLLLDGRSARSTRSRARICRRCS
jgi:osmoprotectant transport system ATP-binding protein